jgi:hypothetical protein
MRQATLHPDRTAVIPTGARRVRSGGIVATPHQSQQKKNETTK